MLPLVTVIIPVYNTERFLVSCLDSILNQTYANLEIILINDGSTDNSLSICKSYAQSDSRIALINKAFNQGASSARNFGIKRSKGDFLSFVDSDDWLEPHTYEHLVKCALENKVDAVIFEYVIHYVNGQIVYRDFNELSGVMNRKEALQNTMFSINRSANTKLYAKKLISNIRFDENIHYGEDTLFACQALNNADSAYYTPKPLYHYMLNNFSLVHRKFNKEIFTNITARYHMVNLCRKNYPDLVGLSLAMYVNKIMLTIIKLYNNSDYPQSFRIIGNLNRIVRRHALSMLLLKNIKKKTRIKLFKLKLFLCFLHPRLYYLLEKSKIEKIYKKLKFN